MTQDLPSIVWLCKKKVIFVSSSGTCNLNITRMLVVSSREFRDKQKSYLDQVDEGVELLVQRGKNKSYKIIPVTEADTIISREYILAPDEDFHMAITMDELFVGVKKDIREMFKNGEK